MVSLIQMKRTLMLKLTMTFINEQLGTNFEDFDVEVEEGEDD